MFYACYAVYISLCSSEFHAPDGGSKLFLGQIASGGDGGNLPVIIIN